MITKQNAQKLAAIQFVHDKITADELRAALDQAQALPDDKDQNVRVSFELECG